MQNLEVSRGLKALLGDMKRQTDIPLQKLSAMQQIYLQRNPNLYTQAQLDRLDQSLKAVSYKFHLTAFSLEQLWALSFSKRDEYISILQQKIKKVDVSDDEYLLISFVFEGFLFQARAFLDFYMLYLCLFLKTGHQGYISTNKFYKALERVNYEPHRQKANDVKEYFDINVFGESDNNNWGMLLKSLRDKVAHKDRIYPSYKSSETIFGEMLFDWPTVQGITYDRFCQNMQNGLFELITDVSPILYELEWKSGSYDPDSW